MFKGKPALVRPHFLPSSRSINVSQGFLVKQSGITNDWIFFNARVITLSRSPVLRATRILFMKELENVMHSRSDYSVSV